MRFGIFDQMERRKVALQEMYAERLRLLEVADEAGFWCYFKSEHHATPLDVAPSTSTWLAAIAARTNYLRIGSLVHLLPFHHPLSLLEEIAMLDHLSGGRLELGVGRGISPVEHKLWGLNPDEARARLEESLAVVLSGMTSDTLTFAGNFWNFDSVPMEIRPLQQPHPPIWYPGNIEIAGSRGFNTLVGGPIAVVKNAIARFDELRAESSPPAGSTRSAPEVGVTFRILLSNDATEAQRRADRAWRHFDLNLTRLWRQAGITELPGNPTANGDFQLASQRNMAFAGTPEMLIDRLRLYVEVGIDLVVLGFDWGDLDAAEVSHSMALFVERVMPDFVAAQGLSPDPTAD